MGQPTPFGSAAEITRTVMEWGRHDYASFPWRQEQGDWFALLAEILLQRTRARNVASIYGALKARFPTPEALASASAEEINEVLGTLGLHWRLPLIKRLAAEVSAKGGVPHKLEELLELPGVGPYVAQAYLSLHLGERAVLIDANVVRWLCRMAGTPMDGETRRKAWVREAAERLTPSDSCTDYNYAVLDFTMNVCTKRPRCGECPLQQSCRYFQSGAIEAASPSRA